MGSDLEEAYEAFNKLTFVMDRNQRRNPVTYMELAALAYQLNRYTVWICLNRYPCS